MATARPNASAIGPAMRSAKARSASASMRTTFSPTLFMGTKDVSKADGRKPFIADYRRKRKRITTKDTKAHKENLRTSYAVNLVALCMLSSDVVFGVLGGE